MENTLDNFIDKDFLQDNLTFTSFYIALYENMVDYVVSNVRDFLCDFSVKDGKVKYKKTKEYKEKIENKVVDEKGNKNITKASFLWFVEHGAISDEDYQSFLLIKDTRNLFAHKLLNVVFRGVEEDEVKYFLDMVSLYRKISNWWFRNIEAGIIGDEIPDNVDISQAQSVENVLFDIMFEVLYKEKSPEYKRIILERKQNNI